MSKHNNRIDEELVCIDSLTHALQSKLSLNIGTPKRVEPGSDPPDFWLPIEEVDTAVEVTSIVQHQAFQHQAREMAGHLKRMAQESGILRGTYAVKFRRFPPIPHPRRKKERYLYEDAMEYIQRTADVSQSEEAALVKDPSGGIVLKKMGATGATVGTMLTRSEWGGESEEKVRDLIDSAARSKIVKLDRSGHSPKDSILALYDAYAFLTFSEVLETSGGLESLTEFDAVYWASAFADRENLLYPDEPGRDGGFIASKRPQWVGVHTLGT